MASSPRDSRKPATRRRVALAAAIGFLLLAAVVILIMPLRLPLPVRLGVIFTDLLAAAILGLLLRQSRDAT